MHGVRQTLLLAQAEAIGLPLEIVPLPWPCDNPTYAEAVALAVKKAAGLGVEVMAFGDLYLADVRAYREAMFHPLGMQTLFPIWGLDTAQLAREMVASGLQATITCLDPQVLAQRFAGRLFDDTFIDELPDSVDPCGEGGEFHTCVTAGPMFQWPLTVALGETVERDGFVFTDLLLVE